MKIFNAEQIRKWDAATIQEDHISQTDLMQRAGTACTTWIRRHYQREVPICILCGKGGNGGDGLVIARGLMEKGYKVSVILLYDPKIFKDATLEHWLLLQQSITDIHKAHIQILQQNKDALTVASILSILEQTKAQVIIDAVLGTGFVPKNTTEHKLSTTSLAIQAVNQYTNSGPKRTKRNIVAIDLPSGLSADTLPAGEDAQSIIQADHTLSFQTYKRTFLHPEAAVFAGKIHLLDIGLSRSFYHNEPTRLRTLDIKAAVKRFRSRPLDSFGHKGSFGTAVLVGGSYGKIGAIALSAKAALRSGVGKVFIQAPKCGYEILQTFIPEAMFEPAGASYIEKISLVKKATYGIGPGMDTHPESAGALLAFISQCGNAVVLDADGLNIIANDPKNYLPIIPKNSILTPHPGEFDRLFPGTDNSLSQVELASANAQKWELIIVLKGHHTAICTPDGKIHYNLSGNAGMATAGSGDVLTGIITSFLSQGYTPKNAALLGVYLHGSAGDLCSKKGSPESLIAHDIIENLPGAFKKLGQRIK